MSFDFTTLASRVFKASKKIIWKLNSHFHCDKKYDFFQYKKGWKTKITEKGTATLKKDGSIVANLFTNGDEGRSCTCHFWLFLISNCIDL